MIAINSLNPNSLRLNLVHLDANMNTKSKMDSTKKNLAVVLIRMNLLDVDKKGPRLCACALKITAINKDTTCKTPVKKADINLKTIKMNFSWKKDFV